VFADASDRPLRLVENADGRLELFAISNQAILHRWQTPEDRWAAWWALPPLANWRSWDVPEILHQPDGRLDVIAVTDQGRRVAAISQNGPNGGWATSWRTITVPFAGAVGTLHVVENPGGLPELYLAPSVPTPGGTLLRTVERAQGDDAWGATDVLTGEPNSYLNAPLFASAADGENRLWIFTGKGGSVVYQRQSAPGVW
jgi:hypothetical protein